MYMWAYVYMECVLSGICGMGEYICAVCVWVGIYVEESWYIWGIVCGSVYMWNVYL